MNIVITGNQAGGDNMPPFTLAKDGVSSPCNFEISTARDIQTLKFLRGKNAKSVDRGNRVVTVSFEVYREFEDVGDAEQFMLLHETTLPGQGTVLFTATLGGFACKMEDAVIESTHSSYIGSTTKHTYQITGGIITV